MVRSILDWLLTLAVAIVLALVIKTYVAEARWIPSGSMEPTLQIGDYLIVDKLYVKYSGIDRKDIVVFNPPAESDKQEVMIKRVIGLPGDEILIKEGIVYANGKPLEEPYEMEKPRADFGPVKVPAGSYFLMGDNRNNSYDSRFWGVVPQKNIIGRAVVKYFPFNHAKVLS
ncbi:MAG TPA: signal peptidase I [Bacillota bacterium]|nr:signal peptidase I [Bacillota bacterium]